MKIIKFFVILINIAFLFTGIVLWKADISANQVDIDVKNLSLEKAQENATKSAKLNPFEPYYHRQKAKVFILLANREKNSYKNFLLKQNALNNLDKALSLNKNNLATIRNNVPYYYFLALNLSDKKSIDKNFEEITKNYYSNIKNNFPNDVGAIVAVAKYEKMLGFSKEFEISKEMIKKLRPDLLEWHPDLIN